MEYIQRGIWGEKLLRQAESHDSFERISIFSPMGGRNVRETGKGSWTKSEDTREGSGEQWDFHRLHKAFSKFNVMLLECLQIHFSQTKRKQNVAWQSSKCFVLSFFFQTPRGGYWRFEAWQFGTVSMMCYLLGGRVAHWSKEFSVCEGRLQAISCASHLSLTHLNLFQRCPQPPRMELSLQRRCSIALSA